MVKVTEQGDIIKINLDPKQGHEQKGYHPYLCLSNRLISQTSNIAVFAPISNTNRDYLFYYPLENLGVESTGKMLRVVNLPLKQTNPLQKVRLFVKTHGDYL